jgi:hypothetical protein
VQQDRDGPGLDALTGGDIELIFAAKGARRAGWWRKSIDCRQRSMLR